MTKIEQRRIAIAAQAKLIANFYRCDAGCKGWAVFQADDGFEIQACDECWHLYQSADSSRLTDDEAAFIPDAVDALKKKCAEYVAWFDKKYGKPERAPRDFYSTEISRWQRSLGVPGLPGLSRQEREDLEEELAVAHKNQKVC